MSRSSSVIVAAVGVALGLIVGIVAGHQATLVSRSQGQSDALALHGRATLVAQHADGQVFANREIDNQLVDLVRNAISSCASGVNTSPLYLGCSNWTTQIIIYDPVTPVARNAPTTNTLTPAGCNPTVPGASCTGWKTAATFDTQIDVAMNVSSIYTGAPAANPSVDVIGVSPALALQPGDRLFVTITFTIP